MQIQNLFAGNIKFCCLCFEKNVFKNSFFVISNFRDIFWTIVELEVFKQSILTKAQACQNLCCWHGNLFCARFQDYLIVFQGNMLVICNDMRNFYKVLLQILFFITVQSNVVSVERVHDCSNTLMKTIGDIIWWWWVSFGSLLQWCWGWRWQWLMWW